MDIHPVLIPRLHIGVGHIGAVIACVIGDHIGIAGPVIGFHHLPVDPVGRSFDVNVLGTQFRHSPDRGDLEPTTKYTAESSRNLVPF